MNSSHNESLIDSTISCIILAGGEGKRVGRQDKGLILLNNKPLIQHVIESVLPQCDEIIISANRNVTQYQKFGHTIVTDDSNSYRGPVAGIAAALPVCQNEWVLVVPCDMPYLPKTLIERLYSGCGQSDIVIAQVEQHLQLAFLINKKLHQPLKQSLDNNQLKLMHWIKSQNTKVISFDNKANFINLNHLSDFE